MTHSSICLPLACCLLVFASGCDGCRIKQPLRLDVDVWKAGGYDYWELDGVLATVTHIGESATGAPFQSGQGAVFTLSYDAPYGGGDASAVVELGFPDGHRPDLAVGDSVIFSVLVDRNVWAGSFSIEIDDLEGGPIVEYYRGPIRNPPAVVESWRVEEGICGTEAYPRMSYRIGEGVLEAPIEVSLYRGEIEVVETPFGRMAVMLGTASMLVSAGGCSDVGSGFEEVAIVRLASP